MSSETPTFIFPDILESERQTGVFPLDYANLAKCTFSHHPKEAEMVQVH